MLASWQGLLIFTWWPHFMPTRRFITTAQRWQQLGNMKENTEVRRLRVSLFILSLTPLQQPHLIPSKSTNDSISKRKWVPAIRIQCAEQRRKQRWGGDHIDQRIDIGQTACSSDHPLLPPLRVCFHAFQKVRVTSSTTYDAQSTRLRHPLQVDRIDEHRNKFGYRGRD